MLLETLSVVRPSLEALIDELVDDLAGTGFPLWLSFRRCRQGLCIVYGQHWGGPERLGDRPATTTPSRTGAAARP